MSRLPILNNNTKWNYVFNNLTSSQISNNNISRYNIDIRTLGATKIENIGSTKREIRLFLSDNYPTFLFMQTTDTFPDYSSKSSIAYRNKSDLSYGDIISGDPQEVFNLANFFYKHILMQYYHIYQLVEVSNVLGLVQLILRLLLENFFYKPILMQ